MSEFRKRQNHASKNRLRKLLRRVAREAVREDKPWLALEAYQELRDAAAINAIGLRALAAEDPHTAMCAFREIGDTEHLRKSAHLALDLGHPTNYQRALLSFRFLRDDEGMERAIRVVVRRGHRFVLDSAIPDELADRVRLAFRRFVHRFGLRSAAHLDLASTLNAAWELGPRYDLAIAVAKGGLYSAYLFGLLGCPVLVAETHWRSGDRRLLWHDDPRGIRGKRVLVLDKDVVTGTSLRIVRRELERHRSGRVDVYLNYNPTRRKHVAGECIGTHLSSVPGGFHRVWYPNVMSYSRYYEGLKALEGVLRGKR